MQGSWSTFAQEHPVNICEVDNLTGIFTDPFSHGILFLLCGKKRSKLVLSKRKKLGSDRRLPKW